MSTATPASITVSVGSGTVSLNTAKESPAARNGASARSTIPEDTMKGSVTTSGRDRPSCASTSASFATDPPPISISRGATNCMTMAGPPF